MHIYDARYAFASTAIIKPPPAPLSAYRKIQQQLGLSAWWWYNRAVTVSTTAALSTPLQRWERLRAASSCPGLMRAMPSLKQLHAAGARGVRYFMLPGGVLSWDTLEPMAARIAPLEWNLNLQLDGRDLAQYATMLSRLPCTLVIDHNGKFLEPVGVEHPGFRTLLALLDRGRCYVKLSAPYETSRLGPPHYADVSVLARALVAANPERCLWASNWPHPNQNPQPSCAAMLDLLLEWAEDEATRRMILVDNPARLYGF